MTTDPQEAVTGDGRRAGARLPIPAPRAHSDGRMSASVDRPEPGTAVVRIRGDLDLRTAAGLAETLSALIGDGTGAVRVELGGVAFMSVAGARVLARAALRAESAGIRFEADPGSSRAAARMFRLLAGDDFEGFAKAQPS